jgi:hypothetical protein
MMMDNLFYIVSAVIALGLLFLIARNLYLMDKRERTPILHAGPPEAEPETEVPPPQAVEPEPTFGAEPPPPPSPAPLPVMPPATSIPPAAPGGPVDTEKEAQPPKPTPIEPPMRGIPADILDRLHEEEDMRGGAAPDLIDDFITVDEQAQPTPVEFSTYYPKEIVPKQWQPLVAYIFKAAAADAVDGDAKQQLGEKINQFREVGEQARQAIREGATVTATPTMTGFQFNPPTVSVGFFEDWHRFDFKLRADTAPLNQATNGRMTFTVEGIIVADIPMSIFVGETVSASQTASASTKPYNAIFCSYSRKDMQIVKRVERAYKALGMEYLRDLISIRSGENWSEALETLIEKADIFQLFWSTTSSASEHVKMEWVNALKYESQRPNFIRPVYWEQPMPPVPEVLSDIHFAYQPDLASED